MVDDLTKLVAREKQANRHLNINNRFVINIILIQWYL